MRNERRNLSSKDRNWLYLNLFVLVSVGLVCSHALAQSCSTPATGATISSSGATQIYVDGTNGSDTSSCGPSTSPCKTIQYGLTQASSHTVAEVIINPGTYREADSLPTTYNEDGNSTLIVEAATAGTVTISGADQWTTWTDNGDGTFTKSWPYTWGYAAQPFTGSGGPAVACLGLRREMVFVNGTPLTQQLQGPLSTPGTFFVIDGQADNNSGDNCPTLSGASNVITIYPPSGTDMSTADVEVSTRAGLFTTPNGMGNLELSGLTFEYDNSPPNNTGLAAIHITGSDASGLGANIEISNVTVEYNNSYGLYLGANEDITVQNSAFTQNGQNGVEVYQPLNFLFTTNSVTYNSWRMSVEGGVTGWDADGMKSVKSHTMEVDNSSFNNNHTGGLWFDYDNRQICIDGDQFEHNLTNGLFIEASEGPVLVYQDQICSNQNEGLQTANSESVTVRQSTVYDSTQDAVFIGGSTSGRSVSDWQTNANYSLVTQDWVLDGDNFATGPDSASGVYLLGTSLSSISPFTSTILSDYNDWYAPNNSTPFYAPGQGGALTFTQWQTLTNQDADSTQNSVTSCALPASEPCIGSDCPGSPITLTICNTGADEKFKVQSANTLAQSFVVPTNATSLSGIQIGLARACSGCTDHSTTVHLRSTLTGSDIWSTTFTPTVSSDDYKNPSWIIVPVSSNISVTAGDTYYLVVTTSNGSTSDYYYWAVSSTQTYSQGYFYSNGTKKDYSSYTILTFQQ